MPKLEFKAWIYSTKFNLDVYEKKVDIIYILSNFPYHELC